jgi:cytochrome c oxidase subunit 4
MSSHASHDKSGSHEQVGHLVPIGILFKTAVALLLLTVVTVWAASFDFGSVNIWVALAIAVLKGSLVVLFFMHLRWDRPFNSVIFLTALGLVALFISFAMTDTTEYAPDMITGNAPLVQQELDAMKK